MPLYTDHSCGVTHYDGSKYKTYITIGVVVTATTMVFVVIVISYTIFRSVQIHVN